MSIIDSVLAWWRNSGIEPLHFLDDVEPQPHQQSRSLRSISGVDVPDVGRSSVESNMPDRMRSALGYWGGVSPIIDFRALALLKHFWIFNPDFSQYVQNIINMTNTGHTLTVTASSKRRAEQALTRLNESAARIYRIGAGVDGLVNAYLAQAAWSGAISSEDVVDFGARRVEKVVMVPVEQIRFRYIDDEYVPHQQPGVGAGFVRSPLGLIPLNPVTYRYYATQTVENSPYAKPPATAALDPIMGPQKDLLENIKYVAKKFGLFGLISISIKKPDPESGESTQAYQSRLRTYQSQVAAAARGVSSTGIIVTYEDQTLEHKAITSDSRGVEEFWKMSEGQVFSAMSSHPVFHGRPDSSTETYANVVYNFMLAQGHNFQRPVKRRQERTYRLDLMLAGLVIEGLAMTFNREPARNPLQQAQADLLNDNRSILKAEKGIISPDQAAQEMGYESAFDPKLINNNPDAAQHLQRLALSGASPSEGRVVVRFNRDSQSYVYVPETINAPSLSETEDVAA
jgi:hypothetical protein